VIESPGFAIIVAKFNFGTNTEIWFNTKKSLKKMEKNPHSKTNIGIPKIRKEKKERMVFHFLNAYTRQMKV